ncbi:MAG: hypothetical protein U0X91_10150 [Spirosomataceae bacterium]
MYSTLLFFHSGFRWLVLAGLVYSLSGAYTGISNHRPFTKTDNAVRHWTATISHIQLTLGVTLYFVSPIIKYFLSQTKEAIQHLDIAFFGLIHSTIMFAAVVIITIGSSLAKRKATDREKFTTIAVWFSIALLLLFAAIPWPFSPLASRPYFRPY